MRRKIYIYLGLILSVLVNANLLSQTTFNTQRNYAFPNESSPVSLAFLNEDINDADTIYIENGHFYRKGERYRFFGTNLAKDGNFPEEEDAKVLAEQLATLGVNCVRLHFIDFPNYSNDPTFSKGVFRYFGQLELSGHAMERLDRLIFELKERGIYINLNLHTAWNYMDKDELNYSSLCNFGGAFPQGKGLDQWVPDLLDMQKQYYSTILNHVNQFTGYAYKNDPVLAMVEINNESSSYKDLIQDKELPKLRDLRSSNTTIAYLDDLFTQKWRDFLKDSSIISTEELQSVWGSADINNIDLPYDISKTAVTDSLKAKRRSFGKFLRDIEDAYYSEIVFYIKNDIGLKRPLTGGQLDWGFWSMEKHFDYTDQHTYYTYGVPAHFKNGSDPRPLYQNSWWRPQNLPLVTAPEDDHWNYQPFIETFASKVKNKPHTISEFNMGYGNHYISEAPLSFATMAKLQDSDAIFLYGHIVSRERTREDISLEINTIPTILAQYLPMAYLFRSADINALSGNEVELPLSLADELNCVETIRRTSPYAATPGYLLQEEPLDFPGQDKAMKYEDTYRFPLENLLKNKIVSVIDYSDNSTVHDPTSVVNEKPWSTTDSRVTFNNDGNHTNKNNYLQFHDGPMALYMGWNTSLGTSGKGELGNVHIQSVNSYNGHFVFSIFNKDGNIGDEGTYIIQLLNGARINPLEYRIVNFTQLSMSPDVINTYQLDDYWDAPLDPYQWIYCNTTFETTDAAINTDVEALDGVINLNLNTVAEHVRLYPLNGNTGTPLANLLNTTNIQNLSLNLNSDLAIMYVLEVCNNASNPDTVAPSAPTNLDTSNVTSNSVDLLWNGSTDNIGVTAYVIYDNGVEVKTVSGTQTTTISDLSTGLHDFYVVAMDDAGNASDSSNRVSVFIEPIECPPAEIIPGVSELYFNFEDGGTNIGTIEQWVNGENTSFEIVDNPTCNGKALKFTSTGSSQWGTGIKITLADGLNFKFDEYDKISARAYVESIDGSLNERSCMFNITVSLSDNDWNDVNCDLVATEIQTWYDKVEATYPVVEGQSYNMIYIRFDHELLEEARTGVYYIDDIVGPAINPSTNIFDRYSDRQKLTVYPNPCTSEFIVDVPSDIGTLSLTSITGSELIKYNISSSGLKTIDVSGLQKGIYLLQFIDQNGQKFTQKIFIK